jgi:hypothetical protein
VASGTKDWFQGRAPTTDGETAEEEGIPPQSSRNAWSIANKPQMGVAIFSVKGNYIMPVYINLVDIRGGGKELTINFSHMTVTIVGKGLEALAEGLRRQVVRYIQAQHKSEFEVKAEDGYIASISVKQAAEPEELGSWAG